MISPFVGCGLPMVCRNGVELQCAPISMEISDSHNIIVDGKLVPSLSDELDICILSRDVDLGSFDAALDVIYFAFVQNFANSSTAAASKDDLLHVWRTDPGSDVILLLDRRHHRIAAQVCVRSVPGSPHRVLWYGVAVHPEQRGGGLGSALMLWVEEWLPYRFPSARESVLQVELSNGRAHRLYKRLGWLPVAVVGDSLQYSKQVASAGAA